MIKPTPGTQFLKTPKRTRIPFTPVMVRSVMAGEKTETRRMKGLDEINKHPDDWHLDGIQDGVATFSNSNEQRTVKIKLPYWEGQTLAVAEPFRLDKSFDKYRASQVDHGVFTSPNTFGTFTDLKIYFESDNTPVPDWAGKLTIGMFMPTRFSRIELPVSQVKVERMNEITPEEAINEGSFFWAREKKIEFNCGDPKSVFFQLWDSVNPTIPSKLNKWVIVVKFQKWGDQTE